MPPYFAGDDRYCLDLYNFIEFTGVYDVPDQVFSEGSDRFRVSDYDYDPATGLVGRNRPSAGISTRLGSLGLNPPLQDGTGFVGQHRGYAAPTLLRSGRFFPKARPYKAGTGPNLPPIR